MKNKTLILIIIGVLIIGGLFFAMKPKSEAPKNQVVSEVVSKDKVIEISVKDKKVVSTAGDLNVKEGDSVTIKVIADISDELHLHGYDKHVELEKGLQGGISFVANLTGKFPMELENSKVELGALEVSPK